ncbi:putative RNA recognition motif domain, nucleotide-binding alpha-beta plait domain superfamily [Helianthus anomalus]
MAGYGRDEGEIPWSEVQYRKNKRARPDGVEMTFLVQNLPNRVSKTLLWRAFQPHGFITDAYVARKKDSRGNHFGFVRYVVAEKVDIVLQAMNTVWIFEAKLNAKDPDPINNNTTYNNNQAGNPGPSNPAFVREGHSFRDLFRDKNVNNDQGSKTITVDGDGLVYALHCIGRSILGTVKDIASLNIVNQILENGGLKDFEKMLIIDLKGVLASVFTKFHVWNGEDLPLECFVSIRISGVPFVLRDNALFERIGSLFGKICKPSEFSWQSHDNSDGVVTIVTSQGSRIEETMILNWKNRRIVARVSELPGCWSPEFVVEKSKEMSEWESNDDVSQRGDDVVEEGEFVPTPEVEAPQSVPDIEKSPKNGDTAPEFEEAMEHITIPDSNYESQLHELHGDRIRRIKFQRQIMSMWTPSLLLELFNMVGQIKLPWRLIRSRPIPLVLTWTQQIP